MKTLATISIVAISMAISGCQMFGQHAAEEPAPLSPAPAPAPFPVVSSGTCVFGSKSGQQSVMTTHSDCALRGGNFLGGSGSMGSMPMGGGSIGPATPAPMAPSGPGVRVETL